MDHNEMVSLVLLLVFVAIISLSPFGVQIFLYKKRDVLKDKLNKLKFGSLYEGIRLYSPYTLTYYPLFLLRRLSFALIMVFLADWVITQLVVLNLSSIAFITFLLRVKPFKDKFELKFTIFNEGIHLTMLLIYFPLI